MRVLRRSAISLLLAALVPAPAAAQNDAADQPPGGAAAEDSGGTFFGLLPDGYAFAPILWGGSISDELKETTSGDRVSRNHQQQLSLQGQTFVLHPALVTLSGSLNLSTAKTADRGRDGRRSNAATGGLNAAALSRTRFPFNLTYSVSDSTVDNVLVRTDFRRHAFGYSQRYRPEDESYSMTGDVNRSEIKANDGVTTQQSYGYGFTTGFGEGHSLGLNLGHSTSESTSGREQELTTASASHGFSLEYYYRVSNSFRYSQTIDRDPVAAVAANTPFNLNASFAQLLNSVMWIPSDDYPLTLNSSMGVDWRSLGDGSVDTRRAFASLVGQYRFSDAVSGNAGVNVAQDDVSTGTTFRSASLDGSLTYSAAQRELWGFQHGWSASTGVNYFRFTGGDSRSLTVSASQGLGRSWPLAEQRGLSLSLQQSASVSAQSGQERGASTRQSTQTLTHDASLTLTEQGDGASFQAGINAQDSRSFSTTTDTTAQSIGLNASGSLGLSRDSSVSASIGWGVSRYLRRDADGSEDRQPWLQSGGGNASYSLLRPFGWRQASYVANLRLNLRNERRLNAFGRELDPYLYSYGLDHALTTRVGLLSASLRNDYAWSETGELTWSWTIRVARDF